MDFKQIYIKFLVLCFFLFLSIKKGGCYKVFSICLPDNYGKINTAKKFYIGAGEPAFGIIYDLKPPLSAFIVYPNSVEKRTYLLKTQFFDQAFNMQRTGYTTSILPKSKGDYYLCIESDYVLLNNGTLMKFFVKTPFHVVEDKGWDNMCGFPLEIKPYTRPYGFVTHGVFWGQVWYRGMPLENGEVTVEKFSPSFLTKEELPKDSYGQINYPYLKKVTKLSKNGFFIVSFESPGWWVISVKVRSGERSYANQMYPLELEQLFWVYVFPQQNNFPKYEYFYPFK